MRSTLQLLLASSLFVVLPACDRSGHPPAPPVRPTVYTPLQLAAHTTLTNQTTVDIGGRAPGSVQVEVLAPSGMHVLPTQADGGFVVTVPLTPDMVNRLWFTGLGSAGQRTAAVGTAVTHDGTPPFVIVDCPAAGTTTYDDAISVVGRVGDALSGAAGLTVTVDGVPAMVSGGVGANGTFAAHEVPLTDGANTLTVVAADSLGNQSTTQVQVALQDVRFDQPRLAKLGGDLQSGLPGQLLGAPLEVVVVDTGGTPMVGKTVTFTVLRGDGRLDDDGQGAGASTLQARTDAAGSARAYWTLATAGGAGQNLVEAKAVGVQAVAMYTARSDAGAPTQITVGSGTNQVAERGAPAPERLRAWVSDGCNGVAGVAVTFQVTRGGGKVDGFDRAVVNTDATGHAEVSLLLGPNSGDHVVVATFGGNQEEYAQFVALGVDRGTLGAPASFQGLVLDNAGCPLGNATCAVIINGQSTPPATTSADGRFAIGSVPPGPALLRVDGTTADLVNGQPVALGSYPALAFDTVVIPGRTNELPTPVLLPRLDPANAVRYSTTSPTILTMQGVEGLQMVVGPGSMTINGQPAPDGTILSLNQVHHDDVPMPMPDGATPLFAWTLQPGGAHFNPPITIVYPNVAGLPPGALGYFLSFDHATGRFEVVATGRVRADGSVLVSEPGTGLTVAGWGCSCPPYAVTGKCQNCEPNCCRDGAAEPISFDWGFHMPSLWLIDNPEVSVQMSLSGTKQSVCCPGDNGRKAEVRKLSGSFNGHTVADFTIPFPGLGNVAQKIDKWACAKLRKRFGDYVSCATQLGMSAKGIGISGTIDATRDDCTGLRSYSGKGPITFDDVDVAAVLDLTVWGTKNSLTLSGTSPMSGTWTASDQSMVVIVTIPSVTFALQTVVFGWPFELSHTFDVNWSTWPVSIPLPDAFQ